MVRRMKGLNKGKPPPVLRKILNVNSLQEFMSSTYKIEIVGKDTYVRHSIMLSERYVGTG